MLDFWLRSSGVVDSNLSFPGICVAEPWFADEESRGWLVLCVEAVWFPPV